MKKIVSIFLMAAALVGCGEDVRFNDPAFQGSLNNELWRSTSREARFNDDGSVTIKGMRGYETMEVRIATVAINDTISFGNNDATMAKFTVDAPESLTVYETTEEGGNGRVVIQEINFTEGYITGEVLFFNAPIVSGLPIYGDLTNFFRGYFYRVPIVN
jgi:hypothetical protein